MNAETGSQADEWEGTAASAGGLVIDWLRTESGLLVRARQLIQADRRDRTALFPWWVEFLLYGAHSDKFNLNGEPQHDGLKIRELKAGIDRDAFRRIDWWQVESVIIRKG